MRIGIDFDNTIVCYDGVFHAAAIARGLIPADLAGDKNSVRDYLNSQGRQDEFTELQGHIYGARMDLASIYPGFQTFVAAARAAGHDVYIVSHKTRFPILGARHDMHLAAFDFLKQRGLVGPGPDSVVAENIFFELTKEEKVARVAHIGCQVFIDDLPEIFSLAGFSEGMRGILFDPQDRHSDLQIERYASWDALQKALIGAGA
jgi:hypothetical protein